MEQKWLLCDLHLHSGYSKITKKGDKKRVKQMTAKEFVDILKKKHVEVFSVTDHNYFASEFYNEIEEYIEENHLPMKALNGVEFDTYVQISETKKDYIHICIYFDDSVNRDDLHKCVSDLYSDEHGAELKPEIHTIINSLYNLKCKFIIVPHGNKKRGLLKILRDFPPAENEKYNKYAMYKIFNAYDVNSKFFETELSFWAKNFYEKTEKFNKIVLEKDEEAYSSISNHLTERIKDKTYVLNEEEEILYAYMMEYGAYFAYFSFSDWHNAEIYNPEINNFMFGRLDMAFEAFEMATLDPISRIILSKEKNIEIPTTLLKTVSFKMNGIEQVVEFSPGLNAIVGKRGSGKSLLLAVLKDLEQKGNSKGAKKNYKSLKITDVRGVDRGNISISEGGLNSITILEQDAIKSIFENPQNAQAEISKYFKDIQEIDLSEIEIIISLGDKIKEFHTNYKNLTSNIISLKKSESYNFLRANELANIEIKEGFTKVIKALQALESKISTIGLNSNLLRDNLKSVQENQRYYLTLIDEYNDIIGDLNEEIDLINNAKNTNQITNNQIKKNIADAVSLINENFDIALNIEKIKIALNNFKISNLPVEVYRKGKYLFVTYYEIAEDIKVTLIDKVLESLKGGPSGLDDLYLYARGDEKIKIRVGTTSVTEKLKKYYESGILEPKKQFFEIKKDDIEYSKEITDYESLKKHIENHNLINLTDASPGMRSVAYLNMLFDLESSILVLDQPEDNIDNDYISNYLVPNIKKQKKIKQLIFVTHNPSVAVYGDAFNYIYVENKESITYTNFFIERKEDKDQLIKILEGGRDSFSNRNKKFGNILGVEDYGN